MMRIDYLAVPTQPGVCNVDWAIDGPATLHRVDAIQECTTLRSGYVVLKWYALHIGLFLRECCT